MIKPFIPLQRDITAFVSGSNFSVFMNTLKSIRNDIELLRFTNSKLTEEQQLLLSDINDIRIEVYRKALSPIYGYLIMSGKLDRFIVKVYQPYIVNTQGPEMIDKNIRLLPIGEA